MNVREFGNEIKEKMIGKVVFEGKTAFKILSTSNKNFNSSHIGECEEVFKIKKVALDYGVRISSDYKTVGKAYYHDFFEIIMERKIYYPAFTGGDGRRLTYWIKGAEEHVTQEVTLEFKFEDALNIFSQNWEKQGWSEEKFNLKYLGIDRDRGRDIFTPVFKIFDKEAVGKIYQE